MPVCVCVCVCVCRERMERLLTVRYWTLPMAVIATKLVKSASDMRQMKDFPRLLEKLRTRISQTNTMLTYLKV